MIIDLLLIFWTFFKIGLFTIGGGYAMIPMIESEVIKLGWLTTEQLSNFLAISESTPGPFAINVATFVGTNVEGVPAILGAMAATIGVITPSFIIILAIYQIYKRVIKNRYFDGAMRGIKAIIIGLIACVAGKLMFNEIFKIEETFSWSAFDWKALIIMGVITGLIFIFKKKASPILLIILAAGLGMLMYGVF